MLANSREMVGNAMLAIALSNPASTMPNMAHPMTHRRWDAGSPSVSCILLLPAEQDLPVATRRFNLA